jgi:2'-5' RNA ligase
MLLIHDTMLLNEIQKKVRSMLLEKDNVVREYGCVMAEVTISDNDWDSIQSHIEDDEIYDKDNDFGREDNPHVTILYGLHKSNADEDIKEVVDTFEPFEVVLEKVNIFENDDFDVVKFSISNDSLDKYNKKLVELPHTNDYPDYKAHLTIAYVQPGEGKEISKRYKDMKSMTYKVDTIRYSKPDRSNEYYKLN